MSFMGGITDFLRGGNDSNAEDALKKAEDAYAGIKTPDLAQLTLPELQQYVQAGIITPEQAAAALQGSNAYNNISTDPAGRQASLDALTKLQEIGDSGGMDAQEKAKLAEIQSKENQTLGSQRASIMDQMDQRGIPSSLMGVQEQLASAGQDAEQAHADALTANADASTRALQAIEAGGSLGNTVEAQQFGEGAQKAAAQNAIDQWNAANQTTVNMNNAAMRAQANTANLSNEQNIENTNTQNENTRTQYNAQLPQTIFNDQMGKAKGMADVYGEQAKNYQDTGNANAGTAATLLNLVAPMPGMISGMGKPPAAPGAPAPTSAIGSMAPDAIMAASHGGKVPGMPHLPGDSPANDTVPALLSPGEIVVPRTAAHDPHTALSFIKHLHRQTAQGAAHPDDIKNVLHALTAMRSGGI